MSPLHTEPKSVAKSTKIVYLVQCAMIMNTFSHCLKITQNVALDFFLILAFSTFFVLLKLTCLVTLFDRKLQGFLKTRQNGSFLAFFISFCPLKM